MRGPDSCRYISVRIQTTKKPVYIALAVIVLAAFAFTMLWFPATPSTDKANKATPSTSALLSGSGATFPQPQINAWAAEFTKKYPTIRVEYAGGGSGKGQSDLLQGVVDFAGSDVPLKTADWQRAKSLYGEVYQIPWIAGGVAFVYNIPEANGANLRLSQAVLVDILLGKIGYWDDPRIKSLNPGVNLPHKEIIFVHRSDASGTNNIVTAFLSKISAEWRQNIGAGLTVEWPLDRLGRGVGAQGNPGVAQTVKNTPYSLGYVELAYTKGLGVVALENALGEYVLPTVPAVKKAIEGVNIQFDPASDVSQYNILNLTLNVKASGAYPIASVSYVIVKGAKAYSPDKARALSLFLNWVFTDGGNFIVEGYAPVAGTFVRAGLQVAEILAKS